MVTTTLFVFFLIFAKFDQEAAEAIQLKNKLIMSNTRLTLPTSRDQEMFQNSALLCGTNFSYSCKKITCSPSGPLLVTKHCATYDQDTQLLAICSGCPYFQLSSYNVTTDGYIRLPRNLSQLNDYMCAPLNRKGIVCSECADGFGPSLNSFGYKCANCTNVWYGVPLFLFLEYVPITVFYLFILAFRISVTSPPMPCFIMYAQAIIITSYMSIYSDFSLKQIMLNDDGDLRLDIKIINTIYGVFSLDYFSLIIPPFCISKHIKTIHLIFCGYISVFYPLVLIFLTWLCVELHGRNVQPLVWLWRPFHRCFVRLRRGWDTKSDIVDVFITFFFLSYSKSMFQTFMLAATKRFRSFNESGDSIELYIRTAVDMSVTAGSTLHHSFQIPAIVNFMVYNLLPPLLLTLYPFKAFRWCLSKCRLNFMALNIFVEKINSCYRNGLEGGRDMRSLAGLYLFLRILVCQVGFISYILFHENG